jgi:hypothetical protein
MLQANANNTNVSKQESLGEVPWEPCLIYCDVAGSTYLASKDGSGELSSDLQPEESRSSALFASFNVSNPGSEANIDLGSSRLYPGPATEASVLPPIENPSPDQFTYFSYANFPGPALPAFYVALPRAWQVCARNCALLSQGGVYAVPSAFPAVGNLRGGGQQFPEWRNDTQYPHHRKTTPVPEPSAILLLGTSCLGVALGLKRQVRR